MNGTNLMRFHVSICEISLMFIFYWKTVGSSLYTHKSSNEQGFPDPITPMKTASIQVPNIHWLLSSDQKKLQGEYVFKLVWICSQSSIFIDVNQNTLQVECGHWLPLNVILILALRDSTMLSHYKCIVPKNKSTLI